MCKYKAAIFDLDGTLLDTLDDLTNSVNFALRSHSLPERRRSQIRHFLGNGIRNLVRNSVGESAMVDDRTFESVFQVFRTHYQANCLRLTRPYDGVLPLLAALKEKGVHLAIVSNKVDSAVQALKAHFFADFIEVAIGESEGVRRKPAPDSVLKAIAYFGCKPEETIYVGDSEVDYATAKNAHTSYNIVLWGFRDKPFLEEVGITCFSENTKDLLYAILGEE